MRRIALVTGGAGLLGSWLIRSLLTRGYQQIYVLARRDSRQSAGARVYAALRSHTNGTIMQQATKSVEVVSGDLSLPGFGLSPRVIAKMLSRTTDIFHAAAVADFRVPLEKIRLSNVKGTQHMLELARQRTQGGNVPLRVHHISTGAVAGTMEGWFDEDQFDCGQHFHNSYEQTKFEAEQLVREYREQNVNVHIYRPGIITGDSRYGMTTNFKMMYQPLHFIALGLFRELPGNAQSLHSLVPVDKVAEAICLLAGASRGVNSTWHIVSSYEVDLGEFIDTASQVFRCLRPKLIPLEHFPRRRLSQLQWSLVEPFVPYLNYRVRFKADRTNDVLRSFGFLWPRMDRAMLTKLFQYCIRCGYIRLRPQ